jgi:diguanylate cyclase (GGDEF)-like protein
MPSYLFGEYLFACWIVEGCAHFADRRWPRALLRRILVPIAAAAIAIPQLIGYEFRAVFMVQSLVLASTFAAALIALAPAVRRDPSSCGLLAMRIALLVLVVTFLYYVPIFGANVLLGEPLPMTLLKLSSAVHLVCEFLLGFGGAVLVLEQSHRGLTARYQDLAANSAKYRIAAERDALTGVYNRHAFFQMLDTLSASDSPVHGCAAMIDVDGLKQLNDSHGHAAGDAALVRVAAAIQRRVRRDDRLFRWGGDEFLLIAPGLRASDLLAHLEAVNPDLAAPDAIAVQVSYGAVEFNHVGELLDAVRHADADMYGRKRERAVQKRRLGFEVVENPRKGREPGARD